MPVEVGQPRPRRERDTVSPKAPPSGLLGTLGHHEIPAEPVLEVALVCERDSGHPPTKKRQMSYRHTIK